MDEKKIKRSEKALEAKNDQKNDKKKEDQKKKNYRNHIFFWAICFWHWLKNLFNRLSIYHRKGSHFIGGYPGAGKTLFMNKLVNEVPKDKYFFITNINEFRQDNVNQYNIFDMFINSQQVSKLPIKDHKNRKLYGVILDEINLKYNRRLNRTKNYSNSFVGLIEFIITHRHQKVPRIYFIGQKLELQDTQLQSLFKYYHNIIFNKQKPIYQYYKRDNKYIVAPKKLFIENFVKGLADEYEQLDDIDKIKITFEDLESYNTFGLAETYEELPQLMSEAQKAKAKVKQE